MLSFLPDLGLDWTCNFSRNLCVLQPSELLVCSRIESLTLASVWTQTPRCRSAASLEEKVQAGEQVYLLQHAAAVGHACVAGRRVVLAARLRMTPMTWLPR